MIQNKFADQKLTKIIENEQSYSDLFILFGHLNQNITISSIQIIEHKLLKLNFSKTFISKTKLLLIELLENISKHQLKNPSVDPYIQIALRSDGITFYSGNSISIADLDILNDKISNYNSLSPEELKKLYMKKLGDGEISKEGNGGLGLLTIFNRSNKQYKHLIEKISSTEYYFNVEIDLVN